jgi:tetratricopeptide (TPR) repeat protein
MRLTSTVPTSRYLGNLCRASGASITLLTALCPIVGHAEAAAPQPSKGTVPGESHPGISLEPIFSEAVIAYNSKNPVEALKVLDRLLKIQPDYVRALELKALLLKSSGKPEESRKNYEALIKASPKEKAGPYHFELGILEYNAKRLDLAASHFEEAIARKFNADASHFFLGLIGFNLSDKGGKIGEAQNHFKAVIEGGSAELKPPAYYYLGLIAYKQGLGPEGTFQLIEARSAARSMPENAIAKDIDKAVASALAPYSKASWFGNLSMMGAYNDNVSTQADALTNTGAASDKSSPQLLIAAGFGRMSSPLDTLQWVGSYRATFNYNSNPETRTLQFFTNTGSLYFTLNPLARTQYGLKVEGSYVFSGQASDVVGQDPEMFDFGPYSKSLEVGPYMRRELSPGTKLSIEAYARPTSNDVTPGQSGYALSLRAGLQQDTNARWWNPTWNLSLDRASADDTLYRSIGGSAGLTNVMRPTGKDTLSATTQLTSFNYTEATPSRNDILIVLRLSEVHRLTDGWTAVADLSYSKNISSEPDSYSYTQTIASAGIAYNF